MNVRIEIRFTYNGSERAVIVDKETDTYIQGQNVHANAERPFATYSKAKMSNVSRLMNYTATA